MHQIIGFILLVLTIPCGAWGGGATPDTAAPPAPPAAPSPAANGPADLGDYVVLGWNDLGMHCMNRDFSALAILPPFNNLWSQVVRRGDPPQLVTQGVQLTYRFPENSESATKVNFWQYAFPLFLTHLQPNIGLTGNGLTGKMVWNGTAFEATGVPITPFNDGATGTEQPYQLAEVTLASSVTGATLDQTQFVVPVSTEIHCDNCHGGHGVSADNAILMAHDEEQGLGLIYQKPVLCASCHASNALGTTGSGEVPPLSQAIHGKHAEEVPDISCYACHPGQQTQCLRDVMFSNGKTCQDCHGSIAQVASSIRAGRRPWLDEPKCASCHPTHAENSGRLYRNSTGHGGLYCTVCHNSPHAILPTVQPRDAVQVQRVQGSVTYIKNCLVCHTRQPLAEGPHGVLTSSLIAQYLLGGVQLTTTQVTRADYNGDGKVDVADVIYQTNRGL